MLKIDLVICFINVTYKACLITIIMSTNQALITGISVSFVIISFSYPESLTPSHV